jgi:hypothetical protein
MNQQFIDYMNNVIGINPYTLNAQQQAYFLGEFEKRFPTQTMADTMQSTAPTANQQRDYQAEFGSEMTDAEFVGYTPPTPPPISSLTPEQQSRVDAGLDPDYNFDEDTTTQPPVTQDPTTSPGDETTIKSSEEILGEMDELFSKWSTLIEDASDMEKVEAQKIIGRQYGGLKSSLQAVLLARGEDLSTIESFMAQADENIARNLSDKLSQVEMNKTKRLADLTANQIRITGDLETALRSQDINQEQFDERMEIAKEQFDKEYELAQDQLDFSYEQLQANIEMQPGVVDILAGAGGQAFGMFAGGKLTDILKDTGGSAIAGSGGTSGGLFSTLGNFASKYAGPLALATTVGPTFVDAFKNIFQQQKRMNQ